jgi:hypothetical protein
MQVMPIIDIVLGQARFLYQQFESSYYLFIGL